MNVFLSYQACASTAFSCLCVDDLDMLIHANEHKMIEFVRVLLWKWYAAFVPPLESENSNLDG